MTENNEKKRHGKQEKGNKSTMHKTKANAKTKNTYLYQPLPFLLPSLVPLSLSASTNNGIIEF